LLLAYVLGAQGVFAGPPEPAEPVEPESITVAALPASGQVTPYDADRADGRAGPVAVCDDGRARAGGALRYRDNGDGTLTDLNTGLMWEKKCATCDGLHEAGNRYRWSADGEAPTIWDWLADLNAERSRGFAGYSDWRIPNITELLSIVDYGAMQPSVAQALRGEGCERECADPGEPGCSCTEPEEYWTSTTFADFPAHALVVYFGLGLVNDRVKTNLHHVRAVRGGIP
jgi:hypothetical protein